MFETSSNITANIVNVGELAPQFVARLRAALDPERDAQQFDQQAANGWRLLGVLIGSSSSACGGRKVLGNVGTELLEYIYIIECIFLSI
jgi:hypothetical protein